MVRLLCDQEGGREEDEGGRWLDCCGIYICGCILKTCSDVCVHFFEGSFCEVVYSCVSVYLCIEEKRLHVIVGLLGSTAKLVCCASYNGLSSWQT